MFSDSSSSSITEIGTNCTPSGKLPVKNSKTLVIVPETDKIITKSANNLPMVETCQADNLNILQVMNADYLLVAKDSISKMKNTYYKNEEVMKDWHKVNLKIEQKLHKLCSSRDGGAVINLSEANGL